VSFQEAVQSVYLKKYADFSGRARRSEFWFGYLAYFIAGIVVSIIDRAIGSNILAYILVLAVVVPFLASGARRLHDTDRSAWWLLLFLTVIGALVLLVFYVLDSQPGTNKYGASPKEIGGYNPNVNPNYS
jgi:uncharacterized membrane protein YhaH (DUF805 family)